MEIPKTIYIFSNGNVACFDSSGEQIGELQKSWMEIWLMDLEKKGVDPTKIESIEMIVNGRNCSVKPFKTSDGGYNWELKPLEQ